MCWWSILEAECILVVCLYHRILVHQVTARPCIATRIVRVPTPFFMVTSTNSLVNIHPLDLKGTHHEDDTGNKWTVSAQRMLYTNGKEKCTKELKVMWREQMEESLNSTVKQTARSSSWMRHGANYGKTSPTVGMTRQPRECQTTKHRMRSHEHIAWSPVKGDMFVSTKNLSVINNYSDWRNTRSV